jgi:paraquat-inducible protein A
MNPRPYTGTMRSAASLGLLSCHACGLLCRAPGYPGELRCPRCHADVHLRKPGSLSRTWALLIAAYILYIPANLFPILYTSSVFESQGNTIMSGVVLFWNSGSYFIAALIFIASIVVPLTKLFALTLLLISVQRRSSKRPHQRTRLYRLVEFIGRWSMLDVYVVALSVALVQIEALASMRAGIGAAAFGAVVVLTMLASKTFDPRLIWDSVDNAEENDD